MAQKDPRQMKTGQVASQARKAGIEGVEKMNKEQMLQAIGQQQPESTRTGHGGGKGDRPAPRGSKPQDWKNIPGNQS